MDPLKKHSPIGNITDLKLHSLSPNRVDVSNTNRPCSPKEEPEARTQCKQFAGLVVAGETGKEKKQYGRTSSRLGGRELESPGAP